MANCANEIGVAYCGGLMTCSGYSAPHKNNILKDNPNFYSNTCAVSSTINNTDADAFIYTNCNRDEDGYSDCSASTPASVLYVVKSSCSPHMFCTYKDKINNGNNTKIINDNRNIWAKKITARYDFLFEPGVFYFENSANFEDLNNLVRNVKAKRTVMEYNSRSPLVNLDVNQFKEKIRDSRYIKISDIINNYTNEKQIEAVVVARWDNITYSASTVFFDGDTATTDVSFIDYSDELTESGRDELNGFLTAITSGSVINISPNVTDSEAQNYTNDVNNRRLDYISGIAEDLGDISHKVTNEPQISIYAEKVVKSNYNRFDGQNANNTKRIAEHNSTYSPYSEFTDGITEAEFLFVNNPTDIPTATTPSMFESCTDLVTCDIPCQMRYISNKTFKGCSSLSSYTTNPDHIDAIDFNAFDSSGIQTAVLGRYTVLQQSAFENAYNLTTIKWNNFGSDEIRCRLTNRAGDSYYWKTNDVDTSGDSGSSIPKNAFKNCRSLTTSVFSDSTYNGLYIPKGFKIVGESAFENCSSLMEVWLNDVTRLHKNAFFNCQNVIVHGTNNVTYFGENALSANSTNVYADGFDATELIEDYAYKNKTISAISASNKSSIVNLPSIKTIGKYAFNQATIDGKLEIVHNKYTKEINDSAFESCKIRGNDTSSGIKISGNTLCTIGIRAFNSCQVINGDCYLYNADIKRYAFDWSSITGNTTIKNCTINSDSFGLIRLDGNLNIEDCDTIGSDAFRQCYQNQNYTCTIKNVGTIDSNCFTNGTLGKCNISATTIGIYAFQSATLGNSNNISCVTIDSDAFRSAYITGNLSVTATSIGYNAFIDANYSGSKIYLTLTGNDIEIGEKAFFNSTLQDFTFPTASRYSIGDSAFTNCHGITNITIPANVRYVVPYMFYGCDYLTSVTLSYGVTSIDECAFQSIAAWGPLTVNIANSVTSIGRYSFSNTNLYVINIPNSVTTIGDYAFYTTSLTSCTIGNGVTSIGDGAFYVYRDLTITINATTPPTLGSSVFNNSYTVVVKVPSGSVSAYSGATGWSSCTIQSQ